MAQSGQSPTPMWTPIIIHRKDSVHDPVHFKSFFCLDGAEFGDELPRRVQEIRAKVGPAVPIVVVGEPADEYSKIHEESNKVIEAGAIYFERPHQEITIDQMAGEISKELARIDEGFEPITRDYYQQISALSQNEAERSFYMNPPFKLSQTDFDRLMERLEIRGSKHQKDD